MTPSQQNAKRAEIERQTAEYLASGKQIQVVPAGWERKAETPIFADWIDGNTAAMVLNWNPKTLDHMIRVNTQIKSKSEDGKRLYWREDVVAHSAAKAGKAKKSAPAKKTKGKMAA